jgi:DNA polymerase-3 subunit delta
MSLYTKRGVSAQKEEVHAATKTLDKGLYPFSFCKIYRDVLGGDNEWVNIMHAFNVFELQDAIGKRDLYKAIRIAQYFENNPKAGPIQLIFPSLYTFFSKLQMIYTLPLNNEKALATSIGVPDWKVKDFMQAAHRYNTQSVEKNILLLHKYNLKSIGVNDVGTADGLLLKEMIVKIFQD